MGELSLDEQLAVVHQTEWIVGPTGAAWTNLVFCQPGAKCLCWMAEESGEFSALGELYGKDYAVDVSKIAKWRYRQG